MNQTQSPRSRKAPSPYLILVLRALLKRPMRLPQIVIATGLDQRTVQAQITVLRESDCVYVSDRVAVRPFGGPWAVYAPKIREI